MKLQVTQENLKNALAIVSRVADPRGSLPILANILLKTDQNRLQISATNLEIAITKRIGSKISQPGSITVPARLMNDFIASLPGGTIDIEVEGNKLSLSMGNYSSTINGLQAEEFPAIPSIENKNPTTLKAFELKQILNQTVFAASNDEARPVLTGIFMTSVDEKLSFVATDSYRLAERKTNASKLQKDLLIPASAAQELMRVLGEAEESIVMYSDESQILFEVGETELVSRLIDGSFPNYRQLLPSESETSFTIDRKEFINITKVASLFARESAGSITLEVVDDQQTITINSVASQVGENTSNAKAKVSGNGQVTLNSRFLIDALGAFEEDEITFSFSGKLSPCVITSKKDNYRHVVMPLKT